ncbi:MAG: uracil-DNA glycosylase [Candidatus Hydrogenedentes bacterium]|nr:uracil-DNA glycosylase [Candidatus Hydrogenedentota bacterium]
MTSDALFQSILEDTRALLQRDRNPRKNTIALLPETAALLEGPILDQPGKAPTDTPATSTPPRPADMSGPATVVEPDLGGAIDALRLEVSGCTKCGLCKTRKQTVFGVGNLNADLVFVGEAPGADEDRLGEPFVGKAGQLLTDIIEKGMLLTRNDVYICNVLKCRPPDNRDPQPDEVAQCEPYLIRQLELIRPRVICALGRHAAQTLLKTTESTGKLRGTWHNYHNIPLRVTYHPAYLLRKPEDKRKTWDDVKQIMKVLRGEESPAI